MTSFTISFVGKYLQRIYVEMSKMWPLHGWAYAVDMALPVKQQAVTSLQNSSFLLCALGVFKTNLGKMFAIM